MNQQLNQRELELVRAANQFKKRAVNLIKADKLSEEHRTVAAACDNLLSQVYAHAENRTEILRQHEEIKKLVQDNAKCPRCHSNAYLKLRGIDKNEQGWKMNRYRCRRCNIDFTWNRPNNPWDMLRFLEDLLRQLGVDPQQGVEAISPDEPDYQMKQQVVENLAKMKGVVDTADQNLRQVQQKDEEMAQMLHEFKNYLLIETIKLDTWENQQK